MKNKNFRHVCLFSCLIMCMNTYAGTVVTIDGLKYDIGIGGTDGSGATVVGYEGSLPENLVIPENIEYNSINYIVSRVESGAFSGNNELKTVEAPNSIKYVGVTYNSENGAFRYCSNLEKIHFPGIKTVGVATFADCSKLKIVDLGNELVEIYENAFLNCTSLTYIVLASTLSRVGWSKQTPGAFENCKMLQTIIFLGEKKVDGYYGINYNYYVRSNLVSWISNEYNYSGSEPDLSYVNNLPAGFNVVSSIDNKALSKDVGTYTLDIPFTFTNDDMSFDVEIPYTYTINPVKLTAKVNDASRLYGDSNPNFSSTYTGFVNNEDESVFTSSGNYTTTATEKTDVGKYAITQSGVTAKNYVFKYEEGTLTVNKASLTASVNNYTRKYGEANPNFEIKYTGLKNGETAPVWTVEPEISTTATQQSDVDVYEIKAVGGEPKNYEMSGITSGSLSITPASLTIKANDFSRLYYEDNPEFTLTYTGFVGDDDPSVLTNSPQINTSATKNSKVGEYAIEVSNAASKNYTISYEKGKLTINKRQLTVSTQDYTRAYNEENPSFELSYIGFVNSEDEKVLLSNPKATTDATSNSDVGTYTVTIDNGVAENYDFNYVNGKLTIEKAYQTLTWDQVLSDVKQYDQVELTATASSGLEVTYFIEGSRICSLVKTGKYQYIDSNTTGESVISAVQEGNKNYWPTTKQYKQIYIKPLSSIRGDVNNDGVVNAADVVTVTNIIMEAE